MAARLRSSTTAGTIASRAGSTTSSKIGSGTSPTSRARARRLEIRCAAMASSKAATVAEYLAELPDDKRAVISAVRDVVNANLPDGYVEGMHFGMIGWAVPLERYPDTYNGHPIGPFGLAAQKNY